METTPSPKRVLLPQPMAELLPSLSGIISKDAAILLTVQKKPRPSTAVTAVTAEKFKPQNLQEMRNDIKALAGNRYQSSKPEKSASKARWNSSVKVDKTISLTSNGKMNNCTARKFLDFQAPKSAPKPAANKRMTVAPSNMQFKKPDTVYRSKVRHEIRISNVYELPETPVVNKPLKHRMSIANKENQKTANSTNRNLKVPNNVNMNKKPPMRNQTNRLLQKKVHLPIDTPISNDSWKSSCETSFLQREKEIDALEAAHHQKKTKPEIVIENRTEQKSHETESSTPFRKYRAVEEYFNNSADSESSIVKENTNAMEKSVYRESKKDESGIASLCSLFKDTLVSKDSTPMEMQLKELKEIREETIRHVKMEMRLVKFLDKAIKDKTNYSRINKSHSKMPKQLINEINRSCSQLEVINKSLSPKSPTYKIPRKNSCLLRRSLYKSMPTVPQDMLTPDNKIDKSDKAFTMYMGMKGKLSFLNTPLTKPQQKSGQDTPAITSHNLQKQLDKLFNAS